MYQVGDIVLYGDMGVCKITSIDIRKFPSTEKRVPYYTLKPIYHQCVIHAPVDSKKVFMRPVISKEDAERLIDLIPSIKAIPFHSKVNSALLEHYGESIKSRDLSDLIELTKSIHAKKIEAEENNRKLGAVDQRFMHQAEELLHEELSVALGITKDDVPDYIATRLGTAENKH